MARKRIIAGIDIGTSKTVTIITAIDEDDSLSIIGVAKSESKGVRKGQIVDIEDATSAIVSSLEAAERMAGYQVSAAFVSVGGIHIASQNSRGVVAVADPQAEIMDHDVSRVVDAAKAVSLGSARRIIHVIPRYFTVDSQDGIKDPVGMSGVRLEVDTHLVTGGMTSLKNIEKCLANVGIDTEGFVSSGLASSESVLTDTEKELGVVLLDIGAGTTDICMYVEGAPSYSIVLPVGARNVTNDIAIGLRISLESAEKLKLYLSTHGRKITHPDGNSRKAEDDDIDLSKLQLPEGMQKVSRKTLVEGIIRPRLNELFGMVAEEIKKSGCMSSVPSGIVITGGGALTVGIQDAARRTLALPFRIGIPRDIKGVTDEVSAPAFATAIGLAKYGVRIEQSESTSSFQIPGLPKNLHLKGSAHKIMGLIKSFLP